MEKGLWEIIEKQITPKVSDKITEEKINSFISKSNQAFSIIYLNLEPEFKRIIDDCSEPMNAWNQFHKSFHPDT